jgi:diaminopimelate epimerase
MALLFSKYHGTGNDFILIDNRRGDVFLKENEIAFLCDRHFGIGADGLILLNQKEGFHFSMTYYNSDGLESTMCGNGARCITKFAHHLGIIAEKASFSAIDGEHLSEIIFSEKGMLIRVRMSDTRIISDSDEGIYLNTGSPHFVSFVEHLAGMDVVSRGRKIRFDESFGPEGTNVDFVQVTPKGLSVRTYERGVENETLSCGTGVTASVIALAYVSGDTRGNTRVRTPGGELTVSYRQDGPLYRDIWLEGPAVFVYSGEIEIPGEINRPVL